MIESWHPDFVLTVGDNAYPQGSAGLLDRDIFGPYAAVMRESAWFPALGNHDVKANGGKPELDAFHSLGNERWYRFTWGNAAVVVLDSDVSVAPGSSQLRFARSALALASCFRFAAWHHPPWEPPGNSISPGLRRNIVPLVEKDGVQVVFEGHLHAYARSRPHHGVLYVAVGTGGAELERRRRRPHDPVRTRRPRALRRSAGRRRRPLGALPLPDGRREGARRLPPELLLATPTDFFRPMTPSAQARARRHPRRRTSNGFPPAAAVRAHILVDAGLHDGAHARPSPARRSSRPALPSRVGAVRLAGRRRGSRPGDVLACARPPAVASPRRRPRLPVARAAEHVPESEADREPAPSNRPAARATRSRRRPAGGRAAGRESRPASSTPPWPRSPPTSATCSSPSTLPGSPTRRRPFAADPRGHGHEPPLPRAPAGRAPARGGDGLTRSAPGSAVPTSTFSPDEA